MFWTNTTTYQVPDMICEFMTPAQHTFGEIFDNLQQENHINVFTPQDSKTKLQLRSTKSFHWANRKKVHALENYIPPKSSQACVHFA